MQVPGDIEDPDDGERSTDETAELQGALEEVADSRRLTGPEPLAAEHDLSDFRCDRYPVFATWLKEHALNNQRSASATHVICQGKKVIGYYCLSAGAVEKAELPNAKMRKNMPDPTPVFVLRRLAVHADWENKGIGSEFLRDAIMRSIRLTEIVAARALLCHAIDENAKAFYKDRGFLEAPSETSPMTMALSLT